MRYILAPEGLPEALRRRLDAAEASVANTGYYARPLDLTDAPGALAALPPRSANLALTARCQLRCAQCPRPPDGEDMPLPRVLEALARLRAGGVERLALHHLGEPFLHPDFPAILAAACRQFRVRLVTNGLLLSAAGNSVILAAQPQRVTVSLDTSHRAAAGAAAEAQALAMLRRLRRERDVRGLDGPVTAVQAVADAALLADAARLRAWQDAADAVEFRPRVWPEEPATAPAAEPCPVAFRHLVVRTDGTMHICCADAAGELAVGNLFTDGMAAWAGERAWQLRRRLLAHDWPSPCRTCAVRLPGHRRAFTELMAARRGTAAEAAGL